MLSIGTGKAVINLDGVLPHDGFEAIRDAMHVRAVVFQNADGSRACLTSIDATSLRDDQAVRSESARIVGCAEDAVWVVVTHTFSTPHVRTPEHLASDEERSRNTLFATRLAEAVRDACAQAEHAVTPVRLQTAKGPCSIHVNRDVETEKGWWLGANPQGFSDQSVRVLRAHSIKDDAVVATLFCADVQASVVQGLRDERGRLLVSADLAGATAARLEQTFGGVAVFLVGTAGDQTPRAKGAEVLSDLSQTLAAEVEQALNNARPLEATGIRLVRKVVTCPAQKRRDFATLAPTRTYEFLEEGTQDTLVSIAQLGNLQVVGLQPEVNSEFGARLRTALPGRTEVLTMVNGAQKYLPCAESYDRITYEAMNSGFARGADEVLEHAIVRMMGEDS